MHDHAQPLLSITNIRSTYGQTVALDDVSLEVADNEFFALLGPSGSGKTTLLRTIAGFESPDRGSISLAGTDLLSLPVNRRSIGLMFQPYALFPHMSVAKNIAYGLEAEGLPREEIKRRVGDTLELTGLDVFAQRKPNQLSGGQRQRVALARALVKRPRVLLLDEPLSALDRKVRADMQAELKRMQHEAGTTFIVVTHDQEEAMSLADRIAVLHDGRIEQVATPEQLYSAPRTQFVAEFIGTSTILPGRVTDSGISIDGFGEVRAQRGFGAAPGALGILVARPEQVKLQAAATTSWSAEILDSTYLGGYSELRLRVQGVGHEIISRIDGKSPFPRGSTAGLRFEPDVTVLPAIHAV